MIAFEVKDLSLFYGAKQALRSIDIKIDERQVIAFIGPSGCGKSSLLRCFNRMNDLIESVKIEGEIVFDGENINDLDVVNLRTRVGMVFQNPNPFPMSIFDNVAYGPRCQGMKNKEAIKELVIASLKQAALYEEVKDNLNASGLSLSGGQQQRLCIARAIALKPEVILMDEPTSALDPIATAKIEQLITELKKDFTIIIVTHSMQQAARISDKTAFFMAGEIIEYDETIKIFHTPKDSRTEDYITGRFG